MQLNAATLTAPTPAGTDLFSLIPTLNATPAASANSSAPIAQNFSALLTEMIGPVAGPQVPGVAVPAVPAVSQAAQVAAAGQAAQVAAAGQVAQVAAAGQVAQVQPTQIAVPQPTAAKEPQKTPSMLPVDPAKPGTPVVAIPENPQVAQGSETPQVPLPLPVVPESAGPQTMTKEPAAKQPNLPVDATLTVRVASPIEIATVMQPAATNLTETALQGTLTKAEEPVPVPTPAQLAAAEQPELERAFADLKSFELTVHNEAAKPSAVPTLQAVQAAAATASPTKQALVTTDPIANIQQQQMPPRVMPIPRVISDVKPERGKSDSLLSSNDTTATSTATGQLTDLIRPVEQPDQVLAAHYVEVPNMPHLQVVRTVAMEVGDPGSEVTIRLQARGGDLTLQLNSGNEPLRQDLESSVGSLVNSLKQAQVQVSNVDVSRKSPLDKVRRMKEAR